MESAAAPLPPGNFSTLGEVHKDRGRRKKTEEEEEEPYSPPFLFSHPLFSPHDLIHPLLPREQSSGEFTGRKWRRSGWVPV